MLELLLNAGADIRKSITPKTDNILHWAVFYGDFKSGIEIFNEYPLMIL